MTIVTPLMGVWPHDAPDKPEEVTVRFEKGRCVSINNKPGSPLDIMLQSNRIAGRNGIGISHALENRLLGTKSRGVYEAPGMTLLGEALMLVYQAVLDRRSTVLFKTLSAHVSDQLYDGRYFDPSTQAALTAIKQLAGAATGNVKVQLYRGNIFFLSLTDCAQSIYKVPSSVGTHLLQCSWLNFEGSIMQICAGGGLFNGGVERPQPCELAGLRRDPESRSNRARRGRPYLRPQIVMQSRNC